MHLVGRILELAVLEICPLLFDLPIASRINDEVSSFKVGKCSFDFKFKVP